MTLFQGKWLMSDLNVMIFVTGCPLENKVSERVSQVGTELPARNLGAALDQYYLKIE